MKSDPFAQLKLLDLQELDSKALQLRTAAARIPELAEIAEVQAERLEVETKARDVRIRVADLSAAQTKAEADVEAVRARRRRDQERMDAGSIGDPKALSAMTHELQNLDRRISVLEDEELEVMEQLEAAQSVLSDLEELLSTYDDRLAALAASRDGREAELHQQLADVLAERPFATDGMPEDLLALYERIRESKGGGAAELRARQCTGCGITLDAAELSRIRGLPSDEVVRCEECGRILVRTAESGL
ncbi:zinc ribbon domain-containing protein [Nocardioides sp. Kera G14]|uniref:zinc ribbon domain-containing protein n=1 Tax=Nocardioides sp. Kera G14 TaxID=2884264 RepID=UPI001D102EFE|nr:C4-type zinc ribbon domain-containing protein [Nocardioides sp. Kera G14]UDY24885.1 C4-type zinc ribbon domain-containing protein [Nocardioides sp. Kera G14]